MSPEERQKLCTELRTADELAFYWRKLAADEIERLAKELKEEKLLRLSERYPDVPCDQLAKQIK